MLNFADANEQILQALSYKGISGIQISFLEHNALLEFTPSKKIIGLLSKMDYNILHAPTNLDYDDSELSNKVLEKIESLHSILNCKCVIFHHNSLKNPKKAYSKIKCRTITVENLDKRTDESINELASFFENNPDYMLTLDFCHAMSRSKEYLSKLISEFKEKIENIHWSLNKDDWLRHYSPKKLMNERAEDVNYMLEKLKKLGKPTVIEIRRNYVKEDFSIINDEIKLLSEQ
jgi:hypothetical protein